MARQCHRKTASPPLHSQIIYKAWLHGFFGSAEPGHGVPARQAGFPLVPKPTYYTSYYLLRRYEFVLTVRNQYVKVAGLTVFGIILFVLPQSL